MCYSKKNALNDKIRNLLLEYDFSKSTDPLQPWASHITSLLTRHVPKTSDIVLSAAYDSFQLHRFLLSARTPYFRRKLADAPETATWKLSQSIPVEAFHFVLRYIYLGDLPKDVVGPDSLECEEEVFKGIDKLSKQLEVEKLWEAVLSSGDRRLVRQRHQDEIARAQRQVESSFRNTVLKHKMVVETRKAGEVKWGHSNAMFADCILRADETDGDEDDDPALSQPDGIPIGPAGAAPLQNGTQRLRRSVLYPVHKAFLIRSPYFETMFSSEFKEAQESEHLHIIKVDCLPEVLEIVLTFLYTEKSDCPLDLALDLLYTSDMLFLDKLKAKAALAISTLGSGNASVLADRARNGLVEGVPPPQVDVESEPINVYDVIRAAWDLNVQRLEDFAARYLAYRLEDYIDEPEFSDFIRESASRVKARQETDTIELLDDIRYYLSDRFRHRFEDAGLDEMLEEDGEVVDPALAGEFFGGGREDGVVAATDPQKANGDAKPPVDEGGGELAVQAEGTVRTLDGKVVEDEFDEAAINYQILLNKIDEILDRLKLDA